MLKLQAVFEKLAKKLKGAIFSDSTVYVMHQRSYLYVGSV